MTIYRSEDETQDGRVYWRVPRRVRCLFWQCPDSETLEYDESNQEDVCFHPTAQGNSGGWLVKCPLGVKE